ncbi:39S ribosomal protein L47, mitochondrial precursor-like [Scleropages formosus]|uniref:Large ribosomal subunit protein uL29m n=1 Tax=Scleropages formosus TaxID=113540 RepID=A0A0P7V804_SCLFO|nr:39S ribosomal protein L47, mitochondrial precursor-like [Scleropages formosus]
MKSKMAATYGLRVLSLSRHFQSAFAISPASQVQHCGKLSFRINALSLPACAARVTSVAGRSVHSRPLHTSQRRDGLMEFFDLPENWGESRVKYVLLKEKNMLLTVEQEAKRQRVQMPSPERLRKVDRSVKRLNTVVQERETALRLLQTGQERARPGAWRRDIFGRTYWYRFKEYSIPWYLNKRYKRKRFYTPYFVNPYIRLRIEQHMRQKRRQRLAEARRQKKLMERFPNMAAKAKTN